MDSIKNIMASQAQGDQTTCIKTCVTHGEYESRTTISVIAGRKRTRETQCPDCEKERKIEHNKGREEAYNKARQDAIMTTLSNVQIPKRYRQRISGIDDIVACNDEQAAIISRCKKYIENYKAISELGSSLIFTGKPGTGKTMIALSMIPSIIKQKYNISFDPDSDTSEQDLFPAPAHPEFIYKNIYDLFAEIKNTYNKHVVETELDILKKYTAPELIVLDEVGAQGGTDYEAQLMFRIINSRYEDMKPTFLISNLTEKDLEKYIGERVVDRFHENHGAVFVFNWDSYRRK